MAKILVVEDEPVPRMILCRLLTREGHEVQTATDATEAVDVGGSFMPDLLIADWLLPDTYNGQYVAERLRELHPSMKILFFTGLPTQKLEQETRHLRPICFLEKPCDFDTIRAAIKDTLANGTVVAGENGETQNQSGSAH
jgi:DNA-binding response OmpR family regulator